MWAVEQEQQGSPVELKRLPADRVSAIVRSVTVP
jgi:hypothetical protein